MDSSSPETSGQERGEKLITLQQIHEALTKTVKAIPNITDSQRRQITTRTLTALRVYKEGVTQAQLEAEIKKVIESLGLNQLKLELEPPPLIKMPMRRVTADRAMRTLDEPEEESATG